MEPFPLTLFGELGSQSSDKHVQAVEAHVGFTAPTLLDENGVRDDATGSAHQRL
jgi:hypothetical protein